MGWSFAAAPVVAVALVLLAVVHRKRELEVSASSHREWVAARERGSHKARLQHPDIDLARCIGCGSCVRACPEEGVLALRHGQAIVVHGARCVGHGLCAGACPTGAIALTLGDLSDRRDLPALHENLEAVGVPGLFLAGELGGFALVRTAVQQGTRVAGAVADRLGHTHRAGRTAGKRTPSPGEQSSAAGLLDLVIVGAGPAGLACSLRAQELGLRLLTIEQEPRIGGTVAAYPRRKLVMTQPMELPLHGKLTRLSYAKEELIEVWERVAAQHALPIRTGVRLTAVRRDPDGAFSVETTAGTVRARNVCLALGRRGSPRKLGVPGEDLPKVAYSLLDAESFRESHILVVGGGDSAVEAALGLAEQPGNTVTVSYRRGDFFRLKARNEARVRKALAEGRLTAVFDSEVTTIEPGAVRLLVGVNGESREHRLPNDHVFVFAGGLPPFPLLENSGVSFDPNDRPAALPAVESRTGLLLALWLLLAVAAGLFAWAWWFRDYYALAPPLRATSPAHARLRPTGPIGLPAAVAACALFLWNLAYLVRRSPRWGRWLPGSLKLWMGTHVFTGVMALLCVLLHAGFAIREAAGGHALLALAVVVASGVGGRYLYAFVPRAANGTEVTLEEVRQQLGALSAEWDRPGRGYAGHVRESIDDLLHAGRWRPGLAARLWALVAGQWRLRRVLRAARRTARHGGVPQREVRRLVALARRAYRLTLLVTHYEEVRAVLASWRYVHRWLALLMILLAAIHIATAARYGGIEWRQLPLPARWWP